LAIKANPKLTDAYIYRGLAHHDLEDIKSAIADFSQAVKIAPDNAAAFQNRGEARLDVGDIPGAIEDLNRAIPLKPNFAEGYQQTQLFIQQVQSGGGQP
jgi:tetratricopeptide (TPR) repeat protein